MQELLADNQKTAAHRKAKRKEDLGFKKEHIVYFLHRFTEKDYTDVECQKRLIKPFVNAVYVYGDKVVRTFNYSGDNRTITMKEIDAGLQQGLRILRACAHQKHDELPLTDLRPFPIDK